MASPFLHCPPTLATSLASSVHHNLRTWIASEMTLNYWMMVERYPNLKDEVGGLNPGCEISSLLDKKLAMSSTAFCVLVLTRRPSVSKKKKKKKKRKRTWIASSLHAFKVNTFRVRFWPHSAGSSGVISRLRIDRRDWRLLPSCQEVPGGFVTSSYCN